MSEPLIEKLKSLDTILRDVRKRYHITLSELKTLKAKPQADITELNQLKLQFAELKNSNRNSMTEVKTLKDKLAALDKEHQTLIDDHKTLTNKHKDLVKQHTDLKKANEVLQEKNRSAAEHTKVVLERLTRIDQPND